MVIDHNIASLLAVRFQETLQHAEWLKQEFITAELAQMTRARFAKTANRSVVGVMNQFAYLAEGYREYLGPHDLLALSLKLAGTPCSPLYKRRISPDRQLKAVVNQWQ